MTVSLEGRRIIVTGAGRNVGEAVAAELVARGARVAVVDLDPATAARTAAALNDRSPGSACAVACDVSDSADVARMVKEVRAALGGVDGLVNSVAITDRGRTVLTIGDDEWDRVLRISLTSVLYTVREVARTMVEDGAKGSIVNIGSTSGYQPRANAIAYPTAKAALLALNKSLALQLGHQGIRVNSVTPNKVGSPVGEAEERDRPRNNLVGRGCEPVDIAKAVAFVMSEDAGFVTGVDLVVDGGALVSMSMD
ncbi:SDR family oxidoreductase [Streptomyces sp. NPDC052077]|uniref:SDR family NAD(P)-dependent oxidoreductase n=1 Tax=Streptomyces sp. NPDC052077 TaxID=3154757 RepID=UPI003417A959